jgi:peptidoglycan/LPS O-acetylase OafA/YrhL
MRLTSTLDGEQSTASPYRPDVDGLRAVAVLFVMLYHAGFECSGGYVGVDVFFVISGFLITGLILREQQTGTFTLANFWSRRIRRIMPAATCMVAVTLVVGLMVLFPRALEQLAASAMAQQLMYSNVYFWLNGGYFDGPAEFKPLLHTWSLAVEEQFYLVFPLLLIATRQWRNGLRLGMLATIAIASLVTSEYLLQSRSSASFYLLPARVWELLIGAILAFLPATARLSSRQRLALAACGLAAIASASWSYDSGTRFPGVAALLPCLGTAAVIYCNHGPHTAIGRMLAAKPFVGVGLISYSLYLWHWPILVFLRCAVGRDLSTVLRGAAMLGSFLAAYLSWRFVETPFRRAGVLTPRIQIRIGTLAVASVLVVVAISARIAAVNTDRARRAELHQRIRSASPPADPVLIIGASDPQTPIRFLLWGDSHAQSISELCDALANQRGIRGGCAVRPGFVPLAGVTNKLAEIPDANVQLDWNRSIVNYAIKKHVTDVIICARWEGKLNGTLRDSMGEPKETDRAENARRVFASGLERTLAIFSRAGIKVWFLRQVPVQLDEPPGRMATAHRLRNGTDLLKGVTRQDYVQQQLDVEEVLQGIDASKLSLLGPGQNWFDESGCSRVTDGRRAFYWDDDHLSVDGAEELIRPLLEPVFDEIESRGARLAATAAP